MKNLILNILPIINLIFVLFYGIVLVICFSGIKNNKKNNIAFTIFFFVILILQGICFYFFGAEYIEKSYPFMVHIPLILFLIFYCKKNWLLSLNSIFTAYLFTIPRRWISTLIDLPFDNNIIFLGTQIIITVPLILLINKYVAPSIKKNFSSKNKHSLLFSAFLIVYYIFIYITTVFSDSLYNTTPVFIDFLGFIVVLIYLFFNALYYQEIEERMKAENYQNIMELNSKYMSEHIEYLKNIQQQTNLYHHDLRHHFSLVSSYLKNGDNDQAIQYIYDSIYKLDNLTVTQYCENETMNLLISSFTTKSSKMNIDFKVKVTLPKNISISNMDLCSILSNALENALNALYLIDDNESKNFELVSGIHRDKIFIRISNNFSKEVCFENGLPINHSIGHGFGVKNIISIVEKHNGIYEFKVENNIFYLSLWI